MTQPNQPIDIEVALQVYLNGFQTGIASTALALGKGEITHEVASGLARALAKQAADDPATMETMRDQIRAHIRGENTGPTILKLYKPPTDS